MKRYLIIHIVACLSMATWAQPRITSDKETHYFGQIEWKKPVTVEYAITNSGDKPLVLNNITTSCACAVANWTKTPIAPGSKGLVSVTFDGKALGHFNKSVGIYSNASPNLIYLHFVGEVVQKVTDFSNLDLQSIGQIMIDKTAIDFPDVQRGEKPVMSLTVVNMSDRPYEPVLMHLPPYLEMKKTPSVLQKGEKGTITLTLNTERLTDLGLTQTSVYLARFSGDKVSEENEIPVSAILLPDLSEMSRTDKLEAPIIQLSETNINLSAQLAKKDKATYDIIMTNTGKSPLQISKLQVFNPAVGVSLKKTKLQPGEYTKLKISLNKKNLKKKRHHLRILMITNDPTHPKVEINLQLSESTN